MKINLHNKKEFDHYFKKKYAEDTIEPSQDLWENINKKIKYKGISANYRNIMKLKIAVITLSVALVGTITYFEFLINNTKQKNPGNTLSSVNTDLKGKSGKNKTNKSQSVISLQDSLNINNQMINNIDKSPLNITENNVFNEPEIFSGKNISINNDTTQKTNYNKLVTSDQRNTEVTGFNNKLNLSGNNDISNIQDTVNNKNNSILVDSNKIISDNKIDIITDNENNSIKNTINETIQKSEKDKKADDLNIVNITSDTISDNLVESKLYSKTKNINLKDSAFNSQRNRKDNLSIKKNIKNKFSFGINVTPQYSYRYLLSNEDFYIPDIGISYFNSHEKGNFSFASGLDIFYQFTGKWKIASGLEYSQYSQKTEIQSFEINKDNQTGYYIYTSVGRNNLIINSSVLPDNASFLKSSIIYSFVNIPLSAEYKLSKNIFINAGINYGFLFNENVNWKAEDYQGDFFINTNSITGFKTSNLSFSAGLGYEQTVYKKFSIIINPQITSFVTSLTNQMPVNTYPYMLGIKLGLRYK